MSVDSQLPGPVDADLVRSLVATFDHHDPRLADEQILPAVHSELRQRCPVQHTDAYGGFWVVSRYDDIAEVSKNIDNFSAAYGMAIPGSLPDPNIPANIALPSMDPPQQTAVRKMLLPWFTPQAAKQREPLIAGIADELIDKLMTTTRCELVSQYAIPLPAIFMMRLLGVPDEMWEPLSEVINQALHTPGKTVDHVAVFEGIAPVLEIAEQRRADPKDDLLSYLVQAEIDGKPLDPLNLFGLIGAMIGGGLDTTSNAIGSALVYLGRHPEVRQQLIDEPTAIPGAVEEFLRMWAPVHGFARYVTHDCQVGQQQIKEGERVFILFASANRDEDHFTDPHEVQIDREPNRHLTFGIGVHRCLGSNYARSEIRIALERFLSRIPEYQVNEDDVKLHADVGMMYGYERISAELAHGSA